MTPADATPAQVVLPREFYERDSREVAPELLNKIIRLGDLAARIIEVEAYAGEEDPGSHAFRGMTKRNATMFGPAGHLYVYFTYGMHWCANVVCGEEGRARAVLLRALTPLDGQDVMYRRRGSVAKRQRDLCSGPAKICQAFGIDGDFDGVDLVAGTSGSKDRALVIIDDGTPPPPDPGVSPRIGLTTGKELPWRWFVSDDPNLSVRKYQP